MEVFDLKYDTTPGGEPRLRYATRGGDGSKVVGSTEPPVDPYCYIEEGDLDMFTCKRHDVRPGGRPAPDGYVALEADDPRDIRDYDDGVRHHTYEADVDLTTTTLVDEGWSIATPRDDEILYFDIEVDDRGAFEDPGDATKRIISIAAISGDGEEFFRDDEYERELLRAFLEFADDYAVLVGWNSIGYDYEYLDNRCLDCGIDADWDRWTRLDLMPLYDTLARPTETLSLKLEDTAERELGEGEGKTDVRAGQGRLYDLWESGDERLEEYNMRDVEILREIEGMFGSVELLHTICDMCGYAPGQSCYEDKYGNVKLAIGMVVDAQILSVARRRGVPMNNRGRHADTGEFPGGDVLDPTPGMHEDVVTLDYSGMYPAIIRAFNLGPSTWHEDAAAYREALGAGAPDPIEGQSGVFEPPSEGRSILAEAAEELDEIRQASKAARAEAPTGSREYEIADQRDKGVKVANNTLFGVFASPFHRYYVPGMSENITLIGQRLVQIAGEIADERPEIDRVLYGDTDSVMLKLSGAGDRIEDAHAVADAVEERMQQWARTRGADGSLLELDVDYVWAKFHQSDKKKRYFGRVVYDAGDEVDEVKVKGLEYRQNDVPEPCRDLQWDLMVARCHEEDVRPIIEDYKERLFAGDFDDSLATRKGLGKPPSEYEADTPPLHVRAALAIREEYGEGEIQTGNKVGYVKYGPRTRDWTWAHRGEMGRGLNATHYGYLWDEKFCGVMAPIGVDPEPGEQASLGAFA